jgi:hypothetical protein
MKALKKIFGAIVVVVGGAFLVLKKLAIAGKGLSVLTGLLTAVLAAAHMGASDSTAAKVATRHKPQRVAQGNASKPTIAEKVAGPSAPAPSGGPALMPSNPLGAGPIQAARNAAAAQNAQLAKETGQEVPPPKGAKPAAPPAQAPAPTQTANNQPAPVMQQGAPKPATNPAPATHPAANANAAEPSVMRETFDYRSDARRDPFVSLMTTSDLRPTLTDLRLTGILYDLSGRRPVAILRDIAGGQWRVTTGMTLGRMRVAQIKPKTIIFTIEEFGFNRQDSLILGDTTRVRRR